MRVKNMFPGSSCAGVVSAGVACFFVGLVMFLWMLQDSVDVAVEHSALRESSTPLIIMSICLWLWGWYFLHTVWKSKYIRRKAAYRIAIILIITGVCSTLLSVLGSSLY